MARRALFLTHTVPLPLVSGERIRNFHFLRAAAGAGWEVSLFSLVHGAPPADEDESALRELTGGRLVLASVDGSRRARYGRAARAIAARRAFHRYFFYTRAAARALESWPVRHAVDVVVAELLYMYPYVPAELRPRTVLDTHNAETRRLEGMAAALGRTPRGLAARLQIGPVQRYESEALRSTARAVAVSDVDRRALEEIATTPVDVVPNGVDTEAIEPRSALPRSPRLLFVGSLDYHANVDAAAYLIDEIVPRLARRDASAAVVGYGAPRSLHKAAQRSGLRVELPGFVDSVAPLFEQCRAFVVPIRFGGGTRLKILEALARGVPVVTTSVGCEGLDLVHEREVLIADDATAFAACVDRLLDDDELATRLSAQGRRTVEERYDWRRLGAEFVSVLDDVRGRNAA